MSRPRTSPVRPNCATSCAVSTGAAPIRRKRATSLGTTRSPTKPRECRPPKLPCAREPSSSQHQNVIPAMRAIVASARTIRKMDGADAHLVEPHVLCAFGHGVGGHLVALVTSDGSVLSFPYVAEGDQASSMLPPRADEVIE